jgi:hypothetical protein
MRRTVSVATVVGLLCVPQITMTQQQPTTARRTSIAGGRHALDSGVFILQLGRELRSDNRKLGLRLSLEYKRQNVRRGGRQWLASDTGPIVGRNTTETHRMRVAGVWLSASYAPVQWWVRPYVIAALGLQDSYWTAERSALDSEVYAGATWPSLPARTWSHGWFGPAWSGGLGVSMPVGRARVFGEARIVAPLLANGPAESPLYHITLPLTFGVRF